MLRDSFSVRELQDLLSCQEPILGSLPVSELLLRATTGPGPDPRRSGPTWAPAPEGTLRPPATESLLAGLPFRLSEDDTWLI